MVQVGMAGLGRMGTNMLLRLQAQGIKATISLDEFVSWLEPPRTACCMVPHAEATGQTVKAPGERFSAEDIDIYGANSFFKDDALRAQQLSAAGIHYVDAGNRCPVYPVSIAARSYLCREIAISHAPPVWRPYREKTSTGGV